ncbi:CIA30 family protein [Photobacterium leiognathi]|uniref:CIA30 family protein n=1 Tax=Photobacterium leiognathi TaxID=553611 RepID=UPI002981533B|nr:CIA30 family protein [Photobacterium leiognathi]
MILLRIIIAIVTIISCKAWSSELKMMDFTNPNEYKQWTAVNDNVMGGISTGKLSYDGQLSLFTGELSFANNGGFSSVNRALTSLNNNINAVKLTYLGDGRTYQLRFTTWKDGYRTNYKHEFVTVKGQQQSKIFYLSDFKAVFRGRLLSDAPALVPEDIKQVGFLIADKQPLPFTLKLIEMELQTLE